MKFGYYVDSDGRPLAYTRKGAKQLPHFIESTVLPRSLHNPGKGKFQKWDFVGKRWAADTEKVAEWEAREQGKKDQLAEAKQAFVELRDIDPDSIDWTNPNQVKQAFVYQKARIVKLFLYIHRSLNG